MNNDLQKIVQRAIEQVKRTLVFFFTQFLLLIGKVLLFVELRYYRFHTSPKGKMTEEKLAAFRAQIWPTFLIFGSYVQKYTFIAFAYIREQYKRFIATEVGRKFRTIALFLWYTVRAIFVKLFSYLPTLKTFFLTLSSYLINFKSYIINLHLMTPPLTKEKKKAWAVIGIIGIVVFALINIYTFRYGAQLARKWEAERIARIPPAPTPTPTPTPIPFKVKGIMKFTTSLGATDGPKMTKCSIDPLDFSTSPTQTFTVDVSHGKPVTSVTAVLMSDNTQKNVPLTLKTGSATSGTWVGSWNVSDTAWYRYQIAVNATDGTNTSNVVVTLR